MSILHSTPLLIQHKLYQEYVAMLKISIPIALGKCNAKLLLGIVYKTGRFACPLEPLKCTREYQVEVRVGDNNGHRP